ncbi:TPA: hypothetical protein ENS27_02970, partial [bacterium]|nr:hypothetical protein [bacterium]
AVFTPVKKVNFKIQDLRIGNKSDYNKLVLEVMTNGVMTVEEAVGYSAKILKETFLPLIHFKDVDEDLEDYVVEEGGGRTESKAEKILKWKAKTPFIEGLRKTIRWNIENIPLEADTISSIPEYNRKEYQIAEIKAQTA